MSQPPGRARQDLATGDRRVKILWEKMSRVMAKARARTMAARRRNCCVGVSVT